MPKDDINSNKPQKPISHADIPQPSSEYVQNGRDLDGVIRRKRQSVKRPATTVNSINGLIVKEQEKTERFSVKSESSCQQLESLVI